MSITTMDAGVPRLPPHDEAPIRAALDAIVAIRTQLDGGNTISRRLAVRLGHALTDVIKQLEGIPADYRIRGILMRSRMLVNWMTALESELGKMSFDCRRDAGWGAAIDCARNGGGRLRGAVLMVFEREREWTAEHIGPGLPSPFPAALDADDDEDDR